MKTIPESILNSLTGQDRLIKPLIIIGINYRDTDKYEYYSSIETTIKCPECGGDECDNCIKGYVSSYAVINDFSGLEIINKVDEFFNRGKVTLECIDQFGHFYDRLIAINLYNMIKAKVIITTKDSEDYFILFEGIIDSPIEYNIDEKLLKFDIITDEAVVKNFGYSMASNNYIAVNGYSLPDDIEADLASTEYLPEVFGRVYNFQPIRLLKPLTGSIVSKIELDEDQIPFVGNYYEVAIEFEGVAADLFKHNSRIKIGLNKNYFPDITANIILGNDGPGWLRCKGIVEVNSEGRCFYHTIVTDDYEAYPEVSVTDFNITWPLTNTLNYERSSTVFLYHSALSPSISYRLEKVNHGEEHDFMVLRSPEGFLVPNCQQCYVSLTDDTGEEILTKCYKQNGRYMYFVDYEEDYVFSGAYTNINYICKNTTYLYTLDKDSTIFFEGVLVDPNGRELSNYFILDSQPIKEYIEPEDYTYKKKVIIHNLKSMLSYDPQDSEHIESYSDEAILVPNANELHRSHGKFYLFDFLQTGAPSPVLPPSLYFYATEDFYLHNFANYKEARESFVPYVNFTTYHPDSNLITNDLVSYTTNDVILDIMHRYYDVDLTTFNIVGYDDGDPSKVCTALDVGQSLESVIAHIGWASLRAITANSIKNLVDNVWSGPSIKTFDLSDIDISAPILLKVMESKELVTCYRLEVKLNDYLLTEPKKITRYAQNFKVLKEQTVNYNYCHKLSVPAISKVYIGPEDPDNTQYENLNNWEDQIITIEANVLDTATIVADTWLNRVIKPFLLLTFTTYIENINLEPYDRVSVNLGTLNFYDPSKGSPFTNIPSNMLSTSLSWEGYISELNLRSKEGLIDITITLDDYNGMGHLS